MEDTRSDSGRVTAAAVEASPSADAGAAAAAAAWVAAAWLAAAWLAAAGLAGLAGSDWPEALANAATSDVVDWRPRELMPG